LVAETQLVYPSSPGTPGTPDAEDASHPDPPNQAGQTPRNLAKISRNEAGVVNRNVFVRPTLVNKWVLLAFCDALPLILDLE
jgi:hypothetical protein